MKKLLFVFVVMISAQFLVAQPTKTGTKPVVKPVVKPAAPLLKTKADSISYILGEVAVFQMMQQGMGELLSGTKLNNAAFMQAVNDIIGKKTPLVSDVTANAMLNDAMMKIMDKKSESEIAAGAKFLAQNKLKPGVKTTASGLQYEVITEGTGPKPTIADTFVVHYRGTLLNGTEFDASFNRGEPLVYGMNQVIPGWTEALLMMGIGSKYKLYIPYNLGYGTRGSGKIPGGATLVFELELLDIRKKPTQ